MRNVVITLVLAFILMGVGFFGSATTAARKEKKCWGAEATRVLKKYGALKTRAQVVKAADVMKDKDANPIDVFDGGDNGCSPGSHGKTLVKFYFSGKDQLTDIQVWRSYNGKEAERVREMKIPSGKRQGQPAAAVSAVKS